MDFSPRFDIGTPVLKDLWIDPVSGDDSRSGATRADALRTLAGAWKRIPETLTDHGWRMLLCPGRYAPPESGQILLENRRGSHACPIVIQSVDGAQSVELPQVSFIKCSSVYLLDVTLSAPGTKGVIPSENIVLHYTWCEDVLVRGVTAIGLNGPNGMPLLTLKANQTKRIYVEDCDISGASGNAIDFVVVHYGHIVRCRLHNTLSECMYVKGGSAYILIANNEMFDSRNHGVNAGQGTGFQYMVPPWLHYEAYHIKVVNNVIHDCGSGMAVFGGYNILMAWNTCYRVGNNRDTIVIGLGGRGWNGPRPPNVDEYFRLGGWSTPQGGEGYNIPNRNVQICNNVILNPDGYESRFAHIGLSGPVATPAGSNLPPIAHADERLVIAGNVIWNGPADKPLLDDVENMYHLAARPTADPAPLLANNAINTLRPELSDPERGDFRPIPGSNLCHLAPVRIPDFDNSDTPTQPPVPPGDTDNQVPIDRNGKPRGEKNCIGAFCLSDESR
jgi:hypothetical protein